MNKELLFQLYAIHSPSGSEKKMRKFVKRYVSNNCGECEITQDKLGNLFIRKGDAESYPCIAAHLDQVQREHSKDFEVIEGNDVVFGYSAKSRSQQGLGADDKNGIWICLECLREFSDLKVALFVGEETGCVGSSDCDLAFFSDCKYIIQPDRMHGGDLITSMYVGDVCSKEFVDALDYKSYGYKEAVGSITDVGELVERGVGISCLNLSCGYYDAHTSHEFTVLSELQNCLDFVCHIIDTLTEKSYPFEYKEDRYGRYGGYGYGSGMYSHWYDDYFYGKKSQPVSPVATKETKHEDVNPYYYDGFYDEDYDMMEQIMLTSPTLTFDELIGQGGWLTNFYTSDLEILKELYDEVCEYHCLGKYAQSSEEFWGDDAFDEPVLKKVS